MSPSPPPPSPPPPSLPPLPPPPSPSPPSPPPLPPPPYQFTWYETAAAVAVFFAMLGVVGCLIYVAVKHRICCPKKDLSVPATPADVQMTDVKITCSAA